MKKRIMGLLFVGVMVASVLTGCGNKSTETQKEANQDTEEVTEKMSEEMTEEASGTASYTYEAKGAMGTDNFQLDLNEDGTCQLSLPENPVITDVYAGTYEMDGDTVTIKAFTNEDDSSEYKTPGLWSWIDPTTGDAAVTINATDGTFEPVE